MKKLDYPLMWYKLKDHINKLINDACSDPSINAGLIRIDYIKNFMEELENENT